MNKTNKTNFKAFQTPSGIADPVKPNREPQPYPGASLVKPNQNQKAPVEESGEMPTNVNVANKMPANVSDETSAKVSGEIPTKVPGEIPVSDPDSASNTTPTPSQNTHQKFMFSGNAHGVIDEEDDDIFPDVYGDEEDYKDDYRDEDDDEYLENDIRSWFYTFMCMNIPIYGWIYLRRLATGKIPTSLEQQDFAEAYLYYKRFFLKISAVILIVLIIVGAIAINKLLAYMQML